MWSRHGGDCEELRDSKDMASIHNLLMLQAHSSIAIFRHWLYRNRFS